MNGKLVKTKPYKFIFDMYVSLVVVNYLNVINWGEKDRRRAKSKRTLNRTLENLRSFALVKKNNNNYNLPFILFFLLSFLFSDCANTTGNYVFKVKRPTCSHLHLQMVRSIQTAQLHNQQLPSNRQYKRIRP